MAYRILCVDDETDLEILMRQNFRRRVRSGELELFFAHNGYEALEVLKTTPEVDIIFSDINMPEMDGLTLLRNIVQLYPQKRAIVISAYGDMANIRTAMNNGAYDFINKPMDFDDLESTLQKTIAEVERVRQSERQKSSLINIQKELAIGKQIQMSFLPTKLPRPEGWSLAAKFEPAKEVAGDFYDAFMIEGENKLGFVIADVCGKGVGPALFMTLVRSLLRAFTSLRFTDAADPKLSIEFTHNYIVQNHDAANLFATVFLGIIDLDTGRLQYVNGGHNAPFIFNSSGIKCFLEPTGPVVGMFPDEIFDVAEVTIEKGDVFFGFTDGVTDIVNEQGEIFGEDRTNELAVSLLNNTPQEMINSLFSKLKEYQGNADQFDDITMLFLRRE